LESIAISHRLSGSKSSASATGRLEFLPGAPRILDFGHCLIRLDLEPPAS